MARLQVLPFMTLEESSADFMTPPPKVLAHSASKTILAPTKLKFVILLVFHMCTPSLWNAHPSYSQSFPPHSLQASPIWPPYQSFPDHFI